MAAKLFLPNAVTANILFRDIRDIEPFFKWLKSKVSAAWTGIEVVRKG